jgi:hypothetical protein
MRRKAVADGLVRDLAHTPSAAELLLIEGISSQVVEGRKLRRLGRSSEMQDRLVSRDLKRLGIRQGAQKPPDDLLAEIAASYARPSPIAQTGAGAPETPASETRISEPGSGHSEAAR